MDSVKLSIITINYNNQKGLKATIQSVIHQDYPYFEYILIDGGSNDGSKDEILKNQSYFSFWCSEKDCGVYHAMNKGIRQAKGEYLLFLNSGDILYHNSILTQIASSLDGTQIVYGDLIFKGNDKEEIFFYPDQLNFDYLFYRSLGHPASFIKRSLFNDNGYSEHLKIVSDWEFFFKKILFEKVSYRHIHHIISIFDTTGISSNEEACMKEHKMVLHQLLPGDLYTITENYLQMKKSPLFPLFNELLNTKKLQYRIIPLLKGLLRINQLFKKNK